MPVTIFNVDFPRLGSVLRAVRIKKGWRQLDVALKCGVSRSAVSRLERGHGREVELGELALVAEALEVRLRIVASWQGGELDRLVNSRHSALHESVARWLLEQPGWVFAPEVSYARFAERGLIDILAWHAATRTLLVIELKTEVVDVNDLMGKVDQKRRLAPEIARERGWVADRVAVWIVVADSRTNRRRVSTHRTTLRAAFPADGRSMGPWIAQPVESIAGLSFWPDSRGETLNVRLATVKRVRVKAEDAA